jgi:hypothetical protein
MKRKIILYSKTIYNCNLRLKMGHMSNCEQKERELNTKSQPKE